MRYGALLIVLITLIISCKTDNSGKNAASEIEVMDDLSAKEDALYQNVMLIHDSAMLLMSNVSSLNRKVKRLRDNTRDAEVKVEVSEVSQALEAANEGMMNWMRNFDPNLDSIMHEETMKYLESEKQKIKSVKRDMETSINNAEELLR